MSKDNKLQNSDKGASWPDVCIKLIDAITESLNKGTAFVLMMFIPLITLMVTAIRMTPEGLDGASLFILEHSSNVFGFMFFMALTNGAWYVVHNNRKKVMQAEIDRLCDERKGIVHGKVVTPLEHHVGSDDPNNNQTLIFPSEDN